MTPSPRMAKPHIEKLRPGPTESQQAYSERPKTLSEIILEIRLSRSPGLPGIAAASRRKDEGIVTVPNAKPGCRSQVHRAYRSADLAKGGSSITPSAGPASLGQDWLKRPAEGGPQLADGGGGPKATISVELGLTGQALCQGSGMRMGERPPWHAPGEHR